jgi:endonuclease YncB( thermonuclease family)
MHLSDLVFDRDVVLECTKTDKYRRQVCVLTVDGQDANLAQVASGFAWWYRKYQKEQTAQQRAEYAAAESKANNEKLGLWADVKPMAPWEWRVQQRQ